MARVKHLLQKLKQRQHFRRMIAGPIRAEEVFYVKVLKELPFIVPNMASSPQKVYLYLVEGYSCDSQTCIRAIYHYALSSEYVQFLEEYVERFREDKNLTILSSSLYNAEEVSLLEVMLSLLPERNDIPEKFFDG